MKTKPMKHQTKGLELLAKSPTAYALGCEQGTGKTWMLLADAERQFKLGLINGLLVIAPKGVHINWVSREIPTHMSVPTRCGFWLAGAGKRHTTQLEKLLKPEDEKLTVLTMNVDAVNTAKGRKFAWTFLQRHDAMMVVDESQKIKSPHAKRTEHISHLGTSAFSRRISSGTLAPNSPADLFSQFNFLSHGMLGTTSYRSFVAEYCELLPAHHPLVREIIAKNKGRGGVPQIVARDKEGRPVYKNLDKLSRLISPHTYRVLKKDCLDLPDKIYNVQPFHLEPAQRKLYEKIKEEKRFEREDGEVDLFTALTIITKLQQITSGFMLVDGEPMQLEHSKARMDALLTLVEDAEGSIIVWARFREEIKQISKALSKFGEVVQYFGDTSDADRELAVDRFQSGEAKFFVANPAAAGTGLTLTRAEQVIYYSNSYDLDQRLQSEDRSHRIGTKHSVVYTDIAAHDTIDIRIASALQTKQGTITQILDSI
jgi:SNF2 family DNA or RNA helicase